MHSSYFVPWILVKWPNTMLTAFQPDVSAEAETGKMYKASFRDREGRTVIIMRPTKEVRLSLLNWHPCVFLFLLRKDHQYFLLLSVFLTFIKIHVYAFIKFQNSTSHDGKIRFLVYVLENAILGQHDGQEKMVWLIDFTGWTMAHATPIKTARECTSILQNHYPERLAIAFLFNPPKVFEAFYKVKAFKPVL